MLNNGLNWERRRKRRIVALYVRCALSGLLCAVYAVSCIAVLATALTFACCPSLCNRAAAYVFGWGVK